MRSLLQLCRAPRSPFLFEGIVFRCSSVTGCKYAGIQLLIDDGNVFGCYSNIDETIYHSELGSSHAILRAGYNLGSFMVRFRYPMLPRDC